MIETLNRLLSRTFDLALAPFAALPPVVGVAVTALVTSVAMLLIFRATSNQGRLLDVKRRIHAGVYEIRLFRDDARAIWRAQREILGHSFRYLGLSLPPLLWMIVPLFLVIAQLQFRFGYEPLEVGELAIVTAELDDGGEDGAGAREPRGLELRTTAGVTVDAPTVWIPSLREANWRIAVQEPGRHSVSVIVGNDAFEKIVDAEPGVRRRSPIRPSSGLVDQLVYPAERPLASHAAVRQIRVEYPDLRISLFGWRMHWLIAFLAFTLVFTLLLRTPLRVTI